MAEAKTGQQTGLPTNIVFGVILRLPFLGGAKMSIVYNVEVAYESRSLVGRTKTVKQRCDCLIRGLSNDCRERAQLQPNLYLRQRCDLAAKVLYTIDNASTSRPIHHMIAHFSLSFFLFGGGLA